MSIEVAHLYIEVDDKIYKSHPGDGDCRGCCFNGKSVPGHPGLPCPTLKDQSSRFICNTLKYLIWEEITHE